MNTTLDKLAKILELERNQAFADRAVIGGLEAFLRVWHDEALGRVPDQILRNVQALYGYSDMPAAERRRRVDAVLAKTQGDAGLAAPPLQPKGRAVESSAGPYRPAAGGKSQRPADERQVQVATRPKQPPRARHGEAFSGARATDPALLDRPLSQFVGYGPRTVSMLGALGLATPRDLLYHPPTGYDDFTSLKTIAELVAGEEVTLLATVAACRLYRTSGSRRLLRVSLFDTTGQAYATFFNQPYLEREFAKGKTFALSGVVSSWAGRPVLTNPAWEPVEAQSLHTRRLVPVYPLTRGLSQRSLRRRVAEAVEKYAHLVDDPLPEALRQNLRLPSRSEAVTRLHVPNTPGDAELARDRLAFDELFLVQLAAMQRRHRQKRRPGIPVTAPRALDEFVARLPFTLTTAQTNAINDIVIDLGLSSPMSRLVQGDVGSGKTAVAAAAAAVTVAAGYQVVVMAPTEILAQQHERSFAELLAPVGFRRRGDAGDGPVIARLSGSLPAADKATIKAEAAAGAVAVLIGTHAVIQADVELPRLALAIVDEQHRFGVSQRDLLPGRATGRDVPHALLMTATPIPRTLALVLHADLDVSVIDTKPPGRSPVATRLLGEEERERAYQIVRSHVQRGHQAYVICPLVEESADTAAPAAESEFARLSETVLTDLRLGLLHGRMPPRDKEAAMLAFHKGETQVLVATTVIEVGVDVPNATVMVIDGANRFGLAQLHQLRGRVGRGESGGVCLLIAEDTAGAAQSRLDALVETDDGLRLAELDLELRGPGDFLGLRQAGESDRFRYARIAPPRVLADAHAAARAVVAADPELSQYENTALAALVNAVADGALRA